MPIASPHCPPHDHPPRDHPPHATARLARRARLLVAAAVLTGTAVTPCVAVAQVAAPTEVVDPQDAARVDPQDAARVVAQQQLTSALSRVATDGSDWPALSQAGRAALAIGDARAAIGFLARAEALAPRDPVIKAAIGAAMVQLEDPAQAMRYFDAAVGAGGLDRTYLGDRGLAFDLLGNQTRAQSDYAVAMQSAPSAELTRRYAISLGISGRSEQAVQMLAPLLRAQDRAAWRSRAMIVAMNGHPDQAREIARTTMPAALAEALSSYFDLMDRLTPVQLAAAAHFGRFPAYETVQGQPSRAAAARTALAAATAAAATPRAGRAANSRRGRRPVAVSPPVVVASTDVAPAITAAPPPLPAAVAVRPAPVRSTRASRRAAREAARRVVPTPSPPAANPTPPPAQIAQNPQSASPPPSPSPTNTAVVAGWSLGDVVQSIAVPETERATTSGALTLDELNAIAAQRRQEQATAAAAVRAREQAAARARAEADARARARLAAETAARERVAEQAAARAEAERLRRNPARHWVQVATGASVSALAFDCRRLAREYATAFAGQNCASAAWNRTRRLLVGPFASPAAARTWDSAYRRGGGDSFVWSSSAGEEVTPVVRR